MRRDLLLEATRALRDTADTSDADSRATRARILATLSARPRVRRIRALRWIPLAACLGTFSAWAATKPFVPALLNEAAQVFGIHEPVRDLSRPKAATSPAVAKAVPEPESATTDVALAESHATSPAVADPAPAAPPKVVPRSSATPSIDVDHEHELYRAAHRAHFVAQDSAAALQAWDAYLGAAPTGRFAVEARYNRALCLLRLGRAEAARAALTPFAEGTFGDYRRREAVELLRALTNR
jgi:hypothetical protein